MTKTREIYKCEICGNIVEVLEEAGGTLVCCGQPMTLQEENSIDASREKHVPILTKNEQGVEINVGSVAHPMTQEHYIQWIEIQTEKGCSRKNLLPGDEPKAFFPVKTEIMQVRISCNLHGLWKN